MCEIPNNWKKEHVVLTLSLMKSEYWLKKKKKTLTLQYVIKTGVVYMSHILYINLTCFDTNSYFTDLIVVVVAKEEQSWTKIAKKKSKKRK